MFAEGPTEHVPRTTTVTLCIPHLGVYNKNDAQFTCAVTYSRHVGEAWAVFFVLTHVMINMMKLHALTIYCLQAGTSSKRHPFQCLWNNLHIFFYIIIRVSFGKGAVTFLEYTKNYLTREKSLYLFKMATVKAEISLTCIGY